LAGGPSVSDARSFLEGLLQRLDMAADDEQRRPPPAAGPPSEHRRMCVGLASHDDPAGVWFTLQSIRLFHPEIADRINFLVVDNHPEGLGAQHLKNLESWIPTMRYLPFRGYRGTAVRDLIFREASAEIVCCIESHVLLAPGALAAIDRYYEDDPESCDLIQGPLLSDGPSGTIATHLDPIWSEQQYGRWAIDPRIGEGGPFEIGMQDLGLFACRRQAWPGFNPRFRGYGGEEGYIQEKVRRAGGRVICHPGVGWTHHAPGNPHGMSLRGLLRNYLIGWRELGWDTTSVERHYREVFGGSGSEQPFESVLEETIEEITNPLSFFDGIFCANDDHDTGLWAQATRRHERLGIAWQVERYAAAQAPDNARLAEVLAFRAMIASARARGYEHVLILADDIVFSDDTLAVMRATTGELSRTDWDLCPLGAAPTADAPIGAPVSIDHGVPARRAAAVAVHRRAYDRILSDIPADSSKVDAWLGRWRGCNGYLSERIADGAFRAHVTSQPLAWQPRREQLAARI